MAKRAENVRRKGIPENLLRGIGKASTSIVDEPARPARRPTRVMEQPVEMPTPDEDEEEWSATLPPIEPGDIKENLSAVPMEEAHYDNLWDWIRTEEDRGKMFFGVSPTTSAEMRTKLVRFKEHLYALMESVPDAQGNVTDVHLGIGGFDPMTDTVAVVHLYLAPHARNRVVEFGRQFMEMAAGTYPGRTFHVYTSNAGLARLYKPIGFTASYFLTWVPPVEAPVTVTPVPDDEVDETAVEAEGD